MTVTFFAMLFSPFPVFSRVCTPCQQHTLPHSPLYIQCYYRYTFANSGEKVLTFKTRIFSHSSSVNSLSSCILFKRNSAILYRTSFAPPSIISPPFSSRNLRTLNSFSQAKHFCPEETPLHHPDFSHGCSLIFFPEILFRYIPAD